jgi:hypothetical protein
MRRSFTLSALVAGLVAAAAGPAAAAPVKSFDIWTGTDFTPGRAHAYGKVDMSSDVNVKVSGRLNDVCPKDGHGAYLRATFVLDNGGTRTQTAKDTTNCTNEDGVDFSFQQLTPSHVIVAVKLHLYEYDADKNSTADITDKRINR